MCSRYVDSSAEDPRRRNAGLFKLFGSAFTQAPMADYKSALCKTSNLRKPKYNGRYARYYRDWRTYQLSDHNPLWVRLKVNERESYLRRLKEA